MKLKITLLSLLLGCSVSYSQSQFINTEFGNNGIACVNIPGDVRQVGDLIKLDDKFYGLTNFSDFNLIKLSADGNIITSFGTNGHVPINIGSGEGGIGYKNNFLIATPSNDLIMVCTFNGQFNYNFIAKTDTNGNPITSFGNNGYVSTWGSDRIRFFSAKIVNNEIILVGAGSNMDPENLENYIIIMKYDLDGNPITSFGNNGILTMNIDPTYILKGAHYFPETGHIVVLADVYSDSDFYNIITKFDLNTNSIDLNFGNGGYIYNYFIENEKKTWTDILFVDNNSIYLAGSEGFTLSESSIFVKKMDLNGEPDLSFGVDGTYLYDIPETGYQTVTDININNNLITLTGTFNPEGSEYENIFLTRVTSSGGLDTTFGNNGLIKNPLYLAVYLSTYKTIIENENRITVATMSHACTTDSEPKPSIIQFIAGTLSTNTVTDTAQFSYYPNPITNNLYFEGEDIDNAEVYDVLGKLVYSTSIKYNALDLSRLQSGMYMVKVYTEGNSRNIKIIKE